MEKATRRTLLPASAPDWVRDHIAKREAAAKAERKTKPRRRSAHDSGHNRRRLRIAEALS